MAATLQHAQSDGLAPAQHYATILPREYYVSDSIFRQEMENVFPRQWSLAGHISQLSQVGDYLVQEFAGESVVIVRTTPDDIRGFLNVCRHRGHALCLNPSGNIRSFSCPYHHWNFGLDGALRRVPNNPDGEMFRYQDFPLWPVHVEVFHGFIYFCTGAQAPVHLQDRFRALEAEIQSFDTVNLKEAARASYDVACNWKNLLENYLECFHCAGGHPTLCVTVDLPSMYGTTESWQDSYFSGRVPLKAGMKTLSMDGQPVAPLLGVFRDTPPEALPDSLGSGFGVLPALSRVMVHVDHVVAHKFNPVAVDHVQWETRWYVRGDALAGVDYDVETLQKPWAITNSEDKAFSERAFRGVRSQRFTPGPLDATREAAVASAHRVYLDMLGSVH